MDKIENEIVSYFLEEFGKTDLTAVRIKPIELKYTNQLDFINNRLRHTILKSINQHEYFSQFETLLCANSKYKTKLINDIDSVYPYLRRLYQNPNLDEVRVTFKDVFNNVDLTEKRLFECFYYLIEPSMFVLNSFDVKDGKVIFNTEKEFYLHRGLIEYNSFSEYLEQANEWKQNRELQEKTTSRKLTPMQKDVEITQRNANELWTLYPSKRVAQMIRDHREDLLKGCTYQKCADSTLRTRIAKLHPNPENYKGGRPLKPKKKNVSDMSDLLKTIK